MKVAEFIVEGFEQMEALTPVDLLRRAGITVDTVSVFNEKNVKSSHNVIIETDKNMKDIDFALVEEKRRRRGYGQAC